MAAMTKDIILAAATGARVLCTQTLGNGGDRFEVAEPRVVIYLMPQMRA